MAEDPMAEALMPEGPMAEAPVPEAPVPEAPVPEEAASPMQDQMQQLAFGGDAVAGPIQQPGASPTGVADDVPMEAPEGAFIINAKAIAKFGRLDFEERILAPAIKALAEQGVNIDLASLKKPSEQVNGKVNIAVSNNEYYIPPQLAEMIGTDLLEKINKRGEAGTEKQLAQQEEQQQAAPPGRGQAPVRAANGLQVGKKKASPKEIDMLARLLISEAGGEGKEGMQVVANVVGNRLFDRKTNFVAQDSYQKVISANLPSKKGKEFTGYDNDNYKDAPQHPKWKEALDLSEKQIAGSLEDVTEGATFYRNRNIKVGEEGSTAQGQEFFDKRVASGRFEIFKTIGGHTIYKDKDSSTYIKNAIPRPKRKPAPPAQQTQNSFMGSAPPIGSPEDERENRIAREQLEAATR